MTEKREDTQHNIRIEDRKFVVITGIKKVKVLWIPKKFILDTILKEA